ncbi:hypothetical protein VE00_08636 [Pseudogymnoascus sp. WSF 3629]|nr:hypothetical protein VE00_08636 [Pseudogymnoascus sp. WSF 3629]
MAICGSRGEDTRLSKRPQHNVAEVLHRTGKLAVAIENAPRNAHTSTQPQGNADTNHCYEGEEDARLMRRLRRNEARELSRTKRSAVTEIALQDLQTSTQPQLIAATDSSHEREDNARLVRRQHRSEAQGLPRSRMLASATEITCQEAQIHRTMRSRTAETVPYEAQVSMQPQQESKYSLAQLQPRSSSSPRLPLRRGLRRHEANVLQMENAPTTLSPHIRCVRFLSYAIYITVDWILVTSCNIVASFSRNPLGFINVGAWLLAIYIIYAVWIFLLRPNLVARLLNLALDMLTWLSAPSFALDPQSFHPWFVAGICWTSPIYLWGLCSRQTQVGTESFFSAETIPKIAVQFSNISLERSLLEPMVENIRHSRSLMSSLVSLASHDDSLCTSKFLSNSKEYIQLNDELQWNLPEWVSNSTVMVGIVFRTTASTLRKLSYIEEAHTEQLYIISLLQRIWIPTLGRLFGFKTYDENIREVYNHWVEKMESTVNANLKTSKELVKMFSREDDLLHSIHGNPAFR